ncbi:hypothetical protein ACFFF5_03385 [Lederbergia wuyishanensis]|uniref:Membrane protein YdbS with pleckstrin-like domain n=1 Tax=Lederbergia wuyishanensis TaxID=1347903 RepID=A0ABU0D029_9BACI|nr:hypothetical protein [Lederbergia wuyishanensis]MCJ8006379.1 hypothetical protein [Lederbergia wuyishanensis]MDQ0341748.1 membrane protein YdbS with pleckstrin-like domain [Lederbergia wuyishanensis]
MEKTYFVMTLVFGWIITVSLAIFTYFAFKLEYSIIGIFIFLILLASISMNIIMIRKWRK